MNVVETRQYEMLVRVCNFGDAHRDLFPGSSLARKKFAAVAKAVKELSGHAASKMRAAKDGASPKTTGRTALVQRLGAISRTARAIGEDTGGLEDKFHLPEPQSDQALLTAGRVFAQDAEAFKSHFVAHAMPKTFIADLVKAVDQFERAIHDRDAGKDEHTAARASIEAALSSGMAAVHGLDVMVANRLQDDPVTLAVWERDRKVRYPNRGGSVIEDAAPTDGAAAQAAATAAAPSVAAAPAGSGAAPQANNGGASRSGA